MQWTECYLGYFPPVETIKEVVGSPLVGVGFQCGLHAGGPGDPDTLLFVIPPVPVEAAGEGRGGGEFSVMMSRWTAEGSTQACFHSQLHSSQKLQQVSTVHVVQVEQQVLAVSGQFDSSQLGAVRNNEPPAPLR